MLPSLAKTNPKTLPREIAAREAEGAEEKDQSCSASIAKRLGTHQISAGLRGSPSKTSITRRQMTKMLVNFLILVLLHIVILDLMK